MAGRKNDGNRSVRRQTQMTRFQIPVRRQVENIHKISSLLQAEGIPHWIDFGTLLGAVREGGLVDTDVDFDIGLLKPDRDRLLALKDRILAETNILLLDAPVIRGCPVHESLTTENEFHAIHSCIHAGLIYIDFYVCEARGRDVLHPLEPYSFKYYFIDELEEISFEGFAFPAPRHRPDFLTHRYGANWRTPMASSEFRKVEYECIIPFARETTAYMAGAFDVHPGGQMKVLERGRKLFERIIAGVYPDEVLHRWQKTQILSHGERVARLRALGLADEIITDPPLIITADFMKGKKIDYLLSGRQMKESFVEVDPDIMRETWHSVAIGDDRQGGTG